MKELQKLPIAELIKGDAELDAKKKS